MVCRRVGALCVFSLPLSPSPSPVVCLLEKQYADTPTTQRTTNLGRVGLHFIASLVANRRRGAAAAHTTTTNLQTKGDVEAPPCPPPQSLITSEDLTWLPSHSLRTGASPPSLFVPRRPALSRFLRYSRRGPHAAQAPAGCLVRILMSWVRAPRPTRPFGTRTLSLPKRQRILEPLPLTFFSFCVLFLLSFFFFRGGFFFFFVLLLLLSFFSVLLPPYTTFHFINIQSSALKSRSISESPTARQTRGERASRHGVLASLPHFHTPPPPLLSSF